MSLPVFKIFAGKKRESLIWNYSDYDENMGSNWKGVLVGKN